MKMLKIDNKEIKAIFFDLDGTLINSEPYYNRFWREAVKEFGHVLSYEQALELRSLDSSLAGQLFEKWYGDFSLYKRAREVRRDKMNEYVKIHPIPLKEGAIEVLTYLKDKGIKSYIVTATRRDDALKMAQDYGIFPFIEEIISTKDVTKGKPNPDVYLYALKVAKLSNDEVLAIEDSPNGIKSAYNANIKGIFIPDLTKPDNSLQKYIYKVLDNLLELKTYLANLYEDTLKIG